jgi:hypothetical protein
MTVLSLKSAIKMYVDRHFMKGFILRHLDLKYHHHHHNHHHRRRRRHQQQQQNDNNNNNETQKQELNLSPL